MGDNLRLQKKKIKTNCFAVYNISNQTTNLFGSQNMTEKVPFKSSPVNSSYYTRENCQTVCDNKARQAPN